MKNSLVQPGAVRAFVKTLLPWFGILAASLLVCGLCLALHLSPPDYQQGETVRIMYVHVPAAWGALLLYVAMALAAISAFVWKHIAADFFLRAAAPVGAGLAALCLITGSIWGRPMWGAWWVWDARLTSMLVLFFLYLGVILLRHGFADAARGAKASQLLLVIGLINIPIIKFSVEWWNTLHQGESLLRKEGPSIDPSMLWPLGIMAFGLFFFCGFVIMCRYLALFGHKPEAK
jgi:heme exporter protein C